MWVYSNCLHHYVASLCARKIITIKATFIICDPQCPMEKITYCVLKNLPIIRKGHSIFGLNLPCVCYAPVCHKHFQVHAFYSLLCIDNYRTFSCTHTHARAHVHTLADSPTATDNSALATIGHHAKPPRLPGSVFPW